MKYSQVHIRIDDKTFEYLDKLKQKTGFTISMIARYFLIRGMTEENRRHFLLSKDQTSEIIGRTTFENS